MDLSQNWMLMALLTPTLWAIACLVDSCLVGARVYRRTSDGLIVSCLFCALPTAAVLGWSASVPDVATAPSVIPVSAIAAGLAYAAHLLFYFRVLFRLNDVSGAETFLSLSVLVVPLFAFLLLGEVLPPRFYLAFLVAGIGVSLQALPVLRRTGTRMAIDLVACVVAVSLSMVLQAHALATWGYATSTLAFNLAGLSVALIVIASRRGARARVVSLLGGVPLVLFAGELLGVLAVLSSHRATQHGPSVSIVALLECLLPLMIVALSLVALGVNRLAPVLTRDLRRTLRLQLQGTPSKSLALLLLAVSMITLSA